MCRNKTMHAKLQSSYVCALSSISYYINNIKCRSFVKKQAEHTTVNRHEVVLEYS